MSFSVLVLIVLCCQHSSALVRGCNRGMPSVLTHFWAAIYLKYLSVLGWHSDRLA